MMQRKARLFVAIAATATALTLDSRALALAGEQMPVPDAPVAPVNEALGSSLAEIHPGDPLFADMIRAAATATAATGAPSLPQRSTVGFLPFKSGLQLQVGRQRIDQTGALFSNSHADARIVGLSDPMERYRMKLFGYRTQPAIQSNGTTLQFTPGKVSSGASLQLDDIEQWHLQSGYFASSAGDWSSQSGGGSNPGLSSPDVGAWNLSADRRWFGKRVETRIEYARTQATFNDIRSNTRSDTRTQGDDAVDFRVDLLSMPWLTPALAKQWSAGVHHRSVGDHYYSTSGIYLPNGLDETDAYLQSSTELVDLKFGWRNEEQAQVEMLGIQPRSQQRATLALTYRPAFADDGPIADLLGEPSLTTRLHSADQIEPEYAVQSQRLPLISTINEQDLTLGFEQPWGRWSLQYQHAYHQREVGAGSRAVDIAVSNLDRDAASLSLNLTPASDISVNLSAQWNQLEEAGNANRYQQNFYNVGARFALIPNTCFVALNYHYADDKRATFNSESYTANQMSSAELSWQALDFNGRQPAIELNLKGSYGMFGDYMAMEFDKRWAAQLSVDLYWGRRNL